VPAITSWKLFREILFESRIMDQIPESVKQVMEDGLQKERHPPSSLSSNATRPVQHFLIGNLRQAAEGVQRAAETDGFACDLRSLTVGNERSDAVQNGRSLAVEAMGNVSDDRKCLIWGGETTVTVRGSGTGGRNQEVALSAGLTLFENNSDILFLSAGTDGVDGPTDAAGAWSDRIQIERMIRAGMFPMSFLKNNDSWSFFDKAGGHLKTGPTHTNVMDLQIALIPPE
jgi:glycerate-2-kinase